jgi:histidinol-phosphate aminotransferase
VQGDATKLYEAMLYKGVIVRSMKAYGYPNFIRITVGTEAENQRFVTALGECLQDLGYVHS